MYQHQARCFELHNFPVRLYQLPSLKAIYLPSHPSSRVTVDTRRREGEKAMCHEHRPKLENETFLSDGYVTTLSGIQTTRSSSLALLLPQLLKHSLQGSCKLASALTFARIPCLCKRRRSRLRALSSSHTVPSVSSSKYSAVSVLRRVHQYRLTPPLDVRSPHP